MPQPPRVSFDDAAALERACIGLKVQRMARAVGRQFDAAFRAIGISGWQFTLLMSLNRETPPTIGALAERLGMDRTTVTNNLKPLERRRLIAIETDAADKRARRVALTEAGRDILARAYPVWKSVQSLYVGRLEGTELDAFRRTIEKLSDSSP